MCIPTVVVSKQESDAASAQPHTGRLLGDGARASPRSLPRQPQPQAGATMEG